ncbi:MAG: HDOD domain-containing protein [Methylophilaceae bacterium]
MTATPESLEDWVAFLSKAEIPVLKHTSREMARLQADPDSVSGRAISSVVLQDPMMVFRVLRYAQTHKSASQVQDIVQIEHVAMMMGTDRFFRELPPTLLVEDILRTQLMALTHLLKLIRRAHRASQYALDWSALLYDLHSEEVGVASLLHDLAEMLMWCYAPQKMLKIYDMQHADKTLRSQSVQLEVLGFKLMDLQRDLAESCQLSPLLRKLIQEGSAKEQRVRNVTLAVNLARHSANGWDDAALPDDYRDISELLRVDVSRVKQIIGVPADQAI